VPRIPHAIPLTTTVLLSLALLAAACSGGDGKAKSPTVAVPVVTTAAGTPGAAITADTSARPAGVPGAATQVLASTQYGDAAANGNETLTSMDCADGVLTVVTSARTVYAELPCDRMLKPDNVRAFATHPVKVRVVPQAMSKVYLESQSAGSAEFTVGRIWVQAK